MLESEPKPVRRPKARQPSASHDGRADAALVAQILRGDVEAYKQLVVRHQEPALRCAYRILGDWHEAEDVVQVMFMRMYQSLPEYEERLHFKAWLFRILINRCNTALESRDRRERLVTQAYGRLYEEAFVPSPEEQVLEDVSSPFVQHALVRALQQIPALCREAFVLKHMEEITYEEMAVITGANVPALKLRVRRARQMLQPLLAGLDGGYHD